MRRVLILSLVVAFAVSLSSCGGGGGSGLREGGVIVAWSYDLFEIQDLLLTDPDCDLGLTDFIIQLRTPGGFVTTEVTVQQPFGLAEIQSGLLEGEIVIGGVPIGDYDVVILSGNTLLADIEMACALGGFARFSLDLPSTYPIVVFEDQFTEVVDIFTPFFEGFAP